MPGMLRQHVRKITACNIKNGLEELKQGQENQLGDLCQLWEIMIFTLTFTQVKGHESGAKWVDSREGHGGP